MSTICPKTITLQHLILGQLSLGRRNVIITSQKSSWKYFFGRRNSYRGLELQKDFRTAISGEFGPLGEFISGAAT